MKRLLPLLLVLILLLSACGGSPEASETKAPDTSPAKTDVPATVPATTEAPAFEEIVLLDSESCAFTVTNITLDDIWGYTISVRCENRSDASQLFKIPDASCQGWLLNPDLTVSVPAGETKESDFNVWPKELARCGLEELDELRIHLTVKNIAEYSAAPYADEILELYPSGKSAEEIGPAPAREAWPAEVLIADNDDFSFTVCGRDEDTVWTYNLVIYLENRTEQDLIFSWKEVSVNGEPTEALWFYYTVPAGLRACFPIYFDEDMMKEAGVEAIETVDFDLVVTPANSFTALYRETHSYTAQ